MPMGMTIEETQKAYCEAAGIPYDKSCITPERIIFITDKDSEIYRSKEWYGVLPDEEFKPAEAFLKRGLTIDGKGTPNTIFQIQNTDSNVQDNRFQGTDSHSAVSSGAAIQPAQPGNSHRADDHISHTGGSQNADAKNLIAFDLFQESAGLKGMNIDTVGSRHSLPARHYERWRFSCDR